ncbi:MAG: UDP-N-acetylglucosamine 2-epimerase (non-hydrolyzing) [Caulobacteraceae bacterium]|nr:UDP-N-acetylglucosamine 2-epimerase (non-hydrolyzing) [Caulobacteraceae bacterium]
MPAKRCRIHLIAGARPNVMKIAPLYKALKDQAWCEPRLVFIAQHYSENMSSDLFAQFGVHDEIVELPLDADNYGDRMGGIIKGYSAFIEKDQPDMVVVPGDVDVALGAALAARRNHRVLVHLEAGLRSYDETMPEEMNRILVDSISDVLLAPSAAAAQNLMYHEGAAHNRVYFVGNIMIDALAMVLNDTVAEAVTARFAVSPSEFAVATFHRPANVDSPDRLDEIRRLIEHLAERTPVVFPVHPRTLDRLKSLPGGETLFSNPRVRTSPPLAYGEFANLVSKARLVVTDSGGIQEETSWLGVPCFTVRDTTERPITVTHGTNTLVDFDDVRAQIEPVLDGATIKGAKDLPLWDGRTAGRVAQVLRTKWKAAYADAVRRTGA